MTSRLARPMMRGEQDDIENTSDNFDRLIKPTTKATTKLSKPSLLVPPGESNYFASGFVHSCIVRHVANSPSGNNTRYHFMFQGARVGCGEENECAMIGEKQGNTIRIFDTSRSIPCFDSSKASSSRKKKSGNYLGKLKRDNTKLNFLLFDSKEESEQLAAFVFDSQSTFWKDGQPPRRLRMGVPLVRNDGTSENRRPLQIWKNRGKNQMAENIKNNNSTGIQVFCTKEPSYERGQYRLNFNGRVTMASVKNMILLDLSENTIAQFGKVGGHRFHLDFKHPLNALQAFALALSCLNF